MTIDRRNFLKFFAGLGGAALFGKSTAAHAGAPSTNPIDRLGVALFGKSNNADTVSTDSMDRMGVLVDTTLCVGCRSCEKACNEINDDLPRKEEKVFEDLSVFIKKRRMDHESYTVVNKYSNEIDKDKPVFTKFQCMHCNDPACVSACIVGAFSKDSNGAVRYDAWKCIGCRYCMTACPFQVPGYEYDNALDPVVRKCTFCFEKRTSKGELPACVESCPMEVMTFGKRKDLLKIARKRIKKNPGKYVPHIYGEREVGGTSWMYLSSVPFENIGFPKLGYASAPSFTEPIQHGIFKYFIPPVALYGLLGGIMYYFKKRNEDSHEVPVGEPANENEQKDGGE